MDDCKSSQNKEEEVLLLLDMIEQKVREFYAKLQARLAEIDNG